MSSGLQKIFIIPKEKVCYGAKSLSDLVKHLSDEELKYTNTIGLHVAGTPLPDCPNPDFKLDEWIVVHRLFCLMSPNEPVVFIPLLSL